MVGNTYEAGDHRAAKGFLEKLHTEYPGTRAQLMSTDIMRMLTIVDRPIPTAWESHVDEWFTPDQGLQFDQGVVVLIFWEVWCPHCMQELPSWQKRYETFAPQGLQLAAFTQLTRAATPEQVRGFLGVHGLTFPIGKDDGTISTANAVGSIPAAAVYQNGTVIFRGHPSLITDALLSEWLHTP
jgi:thiol-disulfide isomerase/thioredoxin